MADNQGPPPSPPRKSPPNRRPPPSPDAPVGWGHWVADGLFGSGDLPPSPRCISPGKTSPAKGTLFSNSLLLTKGLPDHEMEKIWSKRSMVTMADGGTVPAGLPTGITDNEKKLWLAFYCQAREILLSEKRPDVHQAVDAALNDPELCVCGLSRAPASAAFHTCPELLGATTRPVQARR
jgi:hypothetical protein